MAPATPWTPQDDLLLKSAIEAGASFESLAKGDTNFSRKFTVQELQERWNGVLYDPLVSAEASAQMTEIELAKEDNKCFSEKRKFDSVTQQYNAMQKRLCNEPLDTPNLGFINEPDGDNTVGNGQHPLTSECIWNNSLESNVRLDDIENLGSCTDNYWASNSLWDFTDFANEEENLFMGSDRFTLDTSYIDDFSSFWLDSDSDNVMTNTAGNEAFMGLDACPNIPDSTVQAEERPSATNPEDSNDFICCVLNTEDPEVPFLTDDEVAFPLWALVLQIVDMNLSPDDQGSYPRKTGWSNAACMQRHMSSRVAFAVCKVATPIIGVLKKPEAIIAMDEDGSFVLRNLRRHSMFVYGKEVAPKQSRSLSPGCLIEIRGIPFIFEKNGPFIKKFLDEIK